MLSLREMQLATEISYSVEDTRKDLNEIVNCFMKKEYYENTLNVIGVNTRKLSLNVLRDASVFFVDEDESVDDLPEELRAESLGFVNRGKLIFSGRLIYPVKDVRGSVMGFCGWDKFVKPKYLDSKNHGYKAKYSTVYGMEKFPEYYRSKEPVYLVEGIVCCLYLRSKGFQAIALLGSNITKYVEVVLRRFGSRLVIIPDNDVVGQSMEKIASSAPAGENIVRQAKKKLPLAMVVQSKVAKDIDDTRNLDDGEYEGVLISDLKKVYVNPFMSYETIRVR